MWVIATEEETIILHYKYAGANFNVRVSLKQAAKQKS